MLAADFQWKAYQKLLLFERGLYLPLEPLHNSLVEYMCGEISTSQCNAAFQWLFHHSLTDSVPAEKKLVEETAQLEIWMNVIASSWGMSFVVKMLNDKLSAFQIYGTASKRATTFYNFINHRLNVAIHFNKLNFYSSTNKLL